MAIPPLGAFGPVGAGGRIGVVIARQTVAELDGGRKLVALKIRTEDSVGNGPARPGAVPETHALSKVPGAAGPAGRVSPAVQSPVVQPPAEEPSRRAEEAPAVAKNPDRLTPGEKAVVAQLQQRDQQVRQEEKAHAAAAGDLAGPIAYTYQTGPDGRRYAVGGSVPIHARVVSGDPAELASIGARLAAAGQAASNPSGADLAVARAGYGLAAEGAALARRLGQGLDITA